MRRVAAEPEGRSTIDRADLPPGVRSFHIRHSRDENRETPVASPAHVLFDRSIGPELVEIVRVLHDRMAPSRHVGSTNETAKD